MSMLHAQRALDQARDSATSAELIGHLTTAISMLKKALKQAGDSAIEELEESMASALPVPEPRDPGPKHIVHGDGVVMTRTDIASMSNTELARELLDAGDDNGAMTEKEVKSRVRRGRGRHRVIDAGLPTEAEYEAKVKAEVAAFGSEPSSEDFGEGAEIVEDEFADATTLMDRQVERELDAISRGSRGSDSDDDALLAVAAVAASDDAWGDV